MSRICASLRWAAAVVVLVAGKDAVLPAALPAQARRPPPPTTKRRKARQSPPPAERRRTGHSCDSCCSRLHADRPGGSRPRGEGWGEGGLHARPPQAWAAAAGTDAGLGAAAPVWDPAENERGRERRWKGTCPSPSPPPRFALQSPGHGGKEEGGTLPRKAPEGEVGRCFHAQGAAHGKGSADGAMDAGSVAVGGAGARPWHVW